MRVYERSVSPVLYVEWYWLGGRVQKSLKTKTGGHPVTDKRLAMQIAHRISDSLKKQHHRAARESVLGGPQTLGGLLTLYDKAHPNDARFRDFWIEEFGADCPLPKVTPAVVESVTELAKWAPKTRGDYRRYLKAAFTYARVKLRWIDDDLEAVDLPKPTGTSKAYSLAEVRRLLPALEAEDERAGWIGHVAWQTGRRLTAVRKLKKSHVTVHDDHSVLRFPAGTDKAKRSGVAIIVGKAHALTVSLMETPGDYVCGTHPPRKEQAIKGWLARAETAAGVPHVTGRGWHGLKRRYATEARHIAGYDKQAGTAKDTLERRYVQDDKLDEKRRVADALASLTVSETVSHA